MGGHDDDCFFFFYSLLSCVVVLVEVVVKQEHTSSIIKKNKNINVEVKEFCESKENCRRQHMLRCVGSERVESANNSLCCDV